MIPPLFEARGVTKRFDGVVALNNVSFDVRPGEVHALCGENGAGKSTLIKLMSGAYPHGTYEGTLVASGIDLCLESVSDAQHAGVAAIAQELALVPAMSVSENVLLGNLPVRGGLVDWHEVERDACEWLKRLGLEIDTDLPVEALATGQRQLVEIAKVLRLRARVLILDEPTAALSDSEVEKLFKIIKTLRAEGIGIVYVSHRLDEIFQLADRVTVLRDGTVVGTRLVSETNRAQLIRDMVGRELGELYPRHAPKPGPVRLETRGLSARGVDGKMLSDISFSLHAGEVLGVGGLMGAGRTELFLHLFGAWGRRTAGDVLIAGRTLLAQNPKEAIEAGLSLVTEDRRRYGLILDQSVGFNLSLSTLRALSRAGFIDAAEDERRGERELSDLGIRTPGLSTPVGALSGGNQQKVLFGRARMSDPSVLLLDEPTKGVDVGAKIEIYGLINSLTARGIAVILTSSELPELLGVSDRILMMRQGRIAGEFTRGEATQERLIAAALGQEMS